MTDFKSPKEFNKTNNFDSLDTFLIPAVTNEKKESTDSQDQKQPVQLNRSIGVFGGVGIILGTIIGSGIFITPTSILAYSGSVGMFLMVWVICGVVSTLGGLCFADLGVSIPKSGAEYNYILEVFGPFCAFMFLWASVIIIKPASMTIIALTCAIYLTDPIKTVYDFPDDLAKMVAALIILIVTIINIFSVKISIKMNNVLNWFKFACILMIIGIGIAGFVNGGGKYFENSFEGTHNIGMIGMAFYKGLWAYDGWNSLNYAAEEMKNPTRDLPIAIMIGMTAVSVVYVLMNISYVAAIGPNSILSSNSVALTVGEAYIKKAAPLITVLVGLSTFGTANCTLFGNGRLLFVAGREGHLPTLLSAIHNKFRTPIPSLLFTAFISLALLIPKTSDLNEMIDFFNFSSWFYFLVCFVAQIYIRFRRPDIKLKLNVHWLVPAFMCAVSIFLIIIPFIENWQGCLKAIAFIVSGLPIYLLFIRYKRILPKFLVKGNERFTDIMMSVYDLSPATREEDLA